MPEPGNQIVQKNSIRYRKAGLSRFHSHHDMIRFWERAVRRAGLPTRMTEGFNPRPRLVFLHALGVGIESFHEEVELELSRRMDRGELAERLAGAVGDALRVEGVVALPPVKKGRVLVGSAYEFSGWKDGSIMPRVAADLTASQNLVVERGQERKRLDIRQYVVSVASCADGGSVRVELRHTQEGTARPDEIAKLLADAAAMDWRDISIVKTGMTLSG